MKVKFRCDPALADILPRPELARHTLPGWLRSMPATAASDLHGQDIRTVKQCPPFIDAMSAGFMIRLPCDVHVDNGVLSWDWQAPWPDTPGHPRSPLSFHAPAQVSGTPLDQGRMIVKFNSFWTIELEEGWSLLAMHPANREDLPFRLLTGLVDADRFTDVGIFFPALWTDPAFAGTLPAGTPVAQCIPVRREALDLEFSSFSPEQAEAYRQTGDAILDRPGVYRRRYRAGRQS